MVMWTTMERTLVTMQYLHATKVIHELEMTMQHACLHIFGQNTMCRVFLKVRDFIPFVLCIKLFYSKQGTTYDYITLYKCIDIFLV